MPKQFADSLDAPSLTEALAAAPAPGDPAAPPSADERIVVTWLTRLNLLYGIPFNYLVPDIAMLPAEAIRFFQIDPNWIDVMIDGAFSLASAGVLAGRTRSGSSLAALARAASTAGLRPAQPPSGGAPPAPAPSSRTPTPISGFLLRSAVVGGWPGLQVTGYADSAGQKPLVLLRLERLAPSILIGLFGGMVQRVDVQEPSEGLHQGVDPAAAVPTAPTKTLRWAASAGSDAVGTVIPDLAPIAVPLRAGGKGVLAIASLAAAMETEVWPSATPTASQVFTAAEFGLEMVAGVGRVSFQLASPPSPPPSPPGGQT